jgi:hypothetical protein
MTSVRVQGLSRSTAAKAVAELWYKVELHGLETPSLVVEFGVGTHGRVNLVVSLPGMQDADRALRAWAGVWWCETLRASPASYRRPWIGIPIGHPGHNLSRRNPSRLPDRYSAAGRLRRRHGANTFGHGR